MLQEAMTDSVGDERVRGRRVTWAFTEIELPVLAHVQVECITRAYSADPASPRTGSSSRTPRRLCGEAFSVERLTQFVTAFGRTCDVAGGEFRPEVQPSSMGFATVRRTDDARAEAR